MFVEDDIIKMRFVKSANNTADIFTKMSKEMITSDIVINSWDILKLRKNRKGVEDWLFYQRHILWVSQKFNTVKFEGKMIGDKVENIFAKYLFCLDYFYLYHKITRLRIKRDTKYRMGMHTNTEVKISSFFEMCK